MRRKKARQHIRRLRSGKKVLVNKGVKRRRQTSQEHYRGMVQKGFITLDDANRTLIYLGKKPLGYIRPSELEDMEESW